MKLCTNPHHLNANPEVYARGLCQACWARLRRRGTLEPADRTRPPCSIEGCSAPHKARGWCLRHYQAWKRNGDPLGIRGYGQERCTFPGCAADHWGKGFCHVHYMRAYRMQRTKTLSDKGPVLLRIEPFRPILESLVERYGDAREVERGIGLADGHLHNIRHKNKAIHIDVADQLCLFAGVPFSDELVVPYRRRDLEGVAS